MQACFCLASHRSKQNFSRHMSTGVFPKMASFVMACTRSAPSTKVVTPNKVALVLKARSGKFMASNAVGCNGRKPWQSLSDNDPKRRRARNACKSKLLLAKQLFGQVCWKSYLPASSADVLLGIRKAANSAAAWRAQSGAFSLRDWDFYKLPLVE